MSGRPERISLIAAVARNGVIGRDQALPWHLPDDLLHFKQQTMGKPILMGRRNFQSIGRALPGRRNLVLSRAGFEAPGAEVFADLDSALQATAGEPELMVIGGAELYRLALPLADRISLTRIDGEVEGDVFFPAVDWSAWERVAAEIHPADERHAWPFRIEEWLRRQP